MINLPEVVDGRQRLIGMDVIDVEETYEYGVVDNNGADLD